MDGAGGSDEQMQDMYDRESGQCSQCWVTITCLRLFLPRCSTSRCKITDLITRRFFRLRPCLPHAFYAAADMMDMDMLEGSFGGLGGDA